MIFVIDVEADGPTPGIYSMIQIGAVALNSNGIQEKFGINLAPITDNYLEAALKAIHVSRDRSLTFPDAKKSMFAFDDFINRYSLKPQYMGRPIFFSDNNGFDWQFINYYFWKFLNRNPFGFSSNNITNIYGGIHNKLRDGDWKKFRTTKHSHDALDDALGNSEALLTIAQHYNINLDGV